MENVLLEDEDDCPELVPIVQADQIPVTIITGYLGMYPGIRHFCSFF